MASPLDVVGMDSSMLLEHLVLCASERGILIADGAPDKELATAQAKIDQAQLEVMRRMAW